MRSLILVLAMAMAGIAPPRHPVATQPAWQADAPAAARANAGTVTIISGGIDGTYIRIASDLAAVLDDGADAPCPARPRQRLAAEHRRHSLPARHGRGNRAVRRPRLRAPTAPLSEHRAVGAVHCQAVRRRGARAGAQGHHAHRGPGGTAGECRSGGQRHGDDGVADVRATGHPAADHELGPTHRAREAEARRTCRHRVRQWSAGPPVPEYHPAVACTSSACR